MANWTIDESIQNEWEGDIFVDGNSGSSPGFIQKPILTVSPKPGYTVKAEDFTIAGVQGVLENEKFKFTNTNFGGAGSTTPINNEALPQGGIALPDEVDFVLIYDSCPTCFTSEDIYETQNNTVKIEVHLASSFEMPPADYTVNIDVDGTAKPFIPPSSQMVHSFILTSAYRPDIKATKWLPDYDEQFSSVSGGGQYADFLTTSGLDNSEWTRRSWMIPYEDDNTSNIYFQAKFHEGVRERWETYEAQKKQDPRAITNCTISVEANIATPAAQQAGGVSYLPYDGYNYAGSNYSSEQIAAAANANIADNTLKVALPVGSSNDDVPNWIEWKVTPDEGYELLPQDVQIMTLGNIGPLGYSSLNAVNTNYAVGQNESTDYNDMVFFHNRKMETFDAYVSEFTRSHVITNAAGTNIMLPAGKAVLYHNVKLPPSYNYFFAEQTNSSDNFNPYYLDALLNRIGEDVNTEPETIDGTPIRWINIPGGYHPNDNNPMPSVAVKDTGSSSDIRDSGVYFWNLPLFWITDSQHDNINFGTDYTAATTTGGVGVGFVSAATKNRGPSVGWPFGTLNPNTNDSNLQPFQHVEVYSDGFSVRIRAYISNNWNPNAQGGEGRTNLIQVNAKARPINNVSAGMPFSVSLVDTENSGDIVVVGVRNTRTRKRTTRGGFSDQKDTYSVTGYVPKGSSTKIATVRISAGSNKYFKKIPTLSYSGNSRLTLVPRKGKSGTIKTTFDAGKAYAAATRITAYVFDLIYSSTEPSSYSNPVIGNLNFNDISVPSRTESINSVQFGESNISIHGGTRDITVTGTPGTTFNINILNSDENSILTNTNSTFVDRRGKTIPDLRKTINSTGSFSFKQKFPKIPLVVRTAINGSMAASGATRIIFDDLTGVEVGDLLFMAAIPATTTVKVVTLNPTGGNANECDVSDSVTAADDSVAIFRRPTSYSLNIGPSSSFGAAMPTTDPTYTITQLANIKLTIKASVGTNTNITHFNGVATSFSDGDDHTITFTGPANKTSSQLKNNSNIKKKVSFTYLLNGKGTNSFSGRSPFFSKTSAFVKAGEPNASTSSHFGGGSDWTNTIPADNGGTDIDIVGITKTLAADGGTANGLCTIKFDLIINRWGSQDLTIDLDIDRVLTSS